MKQILSLCAMGLLFAGCSTTANNQIDASVVQARAECDAALSSRKITGYVAAARCLDQAEAPWAATAGKNIDLLRYQQAQRRAIFERIDRREITPNQGIAEFQSVVVNSNTIAQQRNTAAAQAAAATMPIMTPYVYQPQYCAYYGATRMATCF